MVGGWGWRGGGGGAGSLDKRVPSGRRIDEIRRYG